MGDHGGRWTQPDGLVPNGLLPSDDIASVTRVLEQDRWSIAEDRTLQLITCIQPDKCSEERRNSVANYVQRLVTNCFSCRVFFFGSVPLKTYLPDGDIDLTAFSTHIDLKDTWANEVREILENEEKNKTAEFHVKEVQYIQAEVKIIKCLVENIVVDVSFNQLGGLCTLCFLEEIDNLIGQDHLFKRSIILIKAWCYYESRVLGAHHGLISTYALETLVLYIFHVFNNSFAGPLEVLYRFLEFFSKFDWDNFCVSLWGPVPISSLPDMTAEPPRKDSGDLLLSQLFLNACSAVYAVLPNGQDNQGQPFVSKHFNVIDPLRTNNNLGRSVSKGNFYRIRSAFQLGAKRLARLLECPKESINAEVDKFFTDTWQRHRNGYRPDAIPPNLRQLQALSADTTEDSENISNHTSSVKRVDAGFPDLENGPIALGRISFQPAGINQHEKNVYRVGRPSSFQKEKSCGSQTSCTDDTGRSMSPSVSMQADKYSKNSRPDYLAKDNVGQARLQFARTHSSPELTDNAVSSFGRQNKMAESTKNQLTSVRPDQTGIRKSFAAEVPGGHAVKSIDDSVFPAHSSSQYGVGTSVDTGSASNRYHSDTSFSVTEEDLASVSQTLELHQEEQDLVNMMASSRLHNLNGQVQLPMHISSRLSVPLPPTIASMGYPQRNMGLVPSNIPIMEPPLGFNMQFHQVPMSAMSSHYLPNAGFESNSEEIGESGSNVPCTTEISQGDGDSGFCRDVNTGSSQMILPDKKFPIPGSDIKRQSAAGEFNFTISSEASGSASPFKRGQPKNVRGNRGLLKEDHGDASVYPNTNDLCRTHGSVDSRFLPASQGSSRNKYISEPWDSPSVKVPKSSRDKRGRRLPTPAGSASSYGRAKNGWNYRDSSPNHASVPTDDKSREWSQQSVLSNDVAEKNVVSSSLAPVRGESYKIPSLESCQMSGSDSVIPVHPMFIYAGSPQGIGNGPGLGSIFYPTGPPVPFYTLSMRNLPSDSVDSDGSGNQFDPDTVRLNSFNQNFGLVDGPGQPEVLETFSSMKDVSFRQPEHTKLDILNSDFSSHWQNLQFGRFCQRTGPQGFWGFTSPVVVPPIHLQSPFPLEGPGRSLPPNVSLLPQNVSHRPQFVPVMPSQAGPDVASDVYQRQGDEVSRNQGGTGTYIPKLKDSFRDRQSFNTRNHRGNYNYNKSDNEDQGNWISSKSKSAGRNHGRVHYDRPNTRPDRLSSTDNQTDRSWDSNRQERISSNQSQNNLSTSSSHGSTSMTHGIYPFPAVNSNGVSPVGPTTPFTMMYPRYDPSARHGSSVGQVEFGSFGSGHLSRRSGVPLTVADDSLSVFEQRSDEYLGGSPCSSPDQPSSPQVQGRQ